MVIWAPQSRDPPHNTALTFIVRIALGHPGQLHDWQVHLVRPWGLSGWIHADSGVGTDSHRWHVVRQLLGTSALLQRDPLPDIHHPAEQVRPESRYIINWPDSCLQIPSTDWRGIRVATTSTFASDTRFCPGTVRWPATGALSWQVRATAGIGVYSKSSPNPPVSLPRAGPVAQPQ